MKYNAVCVQDHSVVTTTAPRGLNALMPFVQTASQRNITLHSCMHQEQGASIFFCGLYFTPCRSPVFPLFSHLALHLSLSLSSPLSPPSVFAQCPANSNVLEGGLEFRQRGMRGAVTLGGAALAEAVNSARCQINNLFFFLNSL